MNQREKEAVPPRVLDPEGPGQAVLPLRRRQGLADGRVVVVVIIVLSIVLGAELGPKANAATTTYVPRPEWYFFFLFELLRVIKPPEFIGLATIGIPTLGMILLFLLPFYDRSAGAPSLRRPIATRRGIFVIVAMALPHLRRRQRRAADGADVTAVGGGDRAGQGRRGRVLRRARGRRAVGLRGLPQDRQQRQRRARARADARRRRASRPPAIARTLVNPTEPMPSFKGLRRRTDGEASSAAARRLPVDQ